MEVLRYRLSFQLLLQDVVDLPQASCLLLQEDTLQDIPVVYGWSVLLFLEYLLDLSTQELLLLQERSHPLIHKLLEPSLELGVEIHQGVYLVRVGTALYVFHHLTSFEYVLPGYRVSVALSEVIVFYNPVERLGNQLFSHPVQGFVFGVLLGQIRLDF